MSPASHHEKQASSCRLVAEMPFADGATNGYLASRGPNNIHAIKKKMQGSFVL
jgi:hypothetical protein